MAIVKLWSEFSDFLKRGNVFWTLFSVYLFGTLSSAKYFYISPKYFAMNSILSDEITEDKLDTPSLNFNRLFGDKPTLMIWSV